MLGLGVYLLIAVRSEPPPLYAARDRPAPTAGSHEVDEPVAAAAPTAGAAEAAGATVAPPTPASAPLAPAGPEGPAAAPAGPDPALAGPKLDAVMAEANKAYDRGDFEEAKAIAARLLARSPTNVRMLRIMVSASCIEGDSAVAQAHLVKLPPGDQEQMKVRCARYGVTFADSP